MFSSIHTCCSQKLTYLFNEQLNSLINPNNIFEYIHKELSSFQWQQFKSQCNDFFQFLFLSVSWNRQFPNFNLLPQSSLPNFTIKLKHALPIANYLSPPPPLSPVYHAEISIKQHRPDLIKIKRKISEIWTEAFVSISRNKMVHAAKKKHGRLPFKTLFVASRYDFPLPRYRRLNPSVIFLRLSLSLSHFVCRTSRSLPQPLTYPTPGTCALVTDGRPVSSFFSPSPRSDTTTATTTRRGWGEGSGSRYFREFRPPFTPSRTFFRTSYLRNELRYRDGTNCELKSVISSTREGGFGV